MNNQDKGKLRWKGTTAEYRSEEMRRVGRLRHRGKTKEERRAHARMMARARWDKLSTGSGLQA